jgi:hypothetical protein
VRPHQSSCLYANTKIGHLRNNSRTFAKRLNLPWFLNLMFLLCLFLILIFYYSCIINFTITIILSLFLSFSLSLLLLCYNPLLSLPTTLSAPFHPIHSFPCLHIPLLSSPTCHHTTHSSYILTTCWLACCMNCTHPQPPAIPDTAPSTTTTETHPNTCKGNKTQQPP